MSLTTEEIGLLRSLVEWRRANGWTYKRGYEEPSRDHNGAPYDDGYLKHRWSKPNGKDEAEAEFVVLLNDDREVASAYYQPDDDAYAYLSWGPRLIRERGLRMVVNGLVDAAELPVRFSSAFQAGMKSVYDRIEYRVMVGSEPEATTHSTIEAFRNLGWRRRGYPDAFLERRFDKEPSAWSRVPEAGGPSA